MNRSNNTFFKRDTTLINETSLFSFAYLSSIIPYLLLEIQSMNVMPIKLANCPKLHVFMLESDFRDCQRCYPQFWKELID